MPNAGKEYATMRKATSGSSIVPSVPISSPAMALTPAADVLAALGTAPSQDLLTQFARQGAQRMLAQAMQEEVQVYVEARADLRDQQGRQLVVRNGHLPSRSVLTGIGPIEVTQPRVRDRRPEHQREKFTPAILPPYLRKAKSVEELLPWLYLYGVSSNDFEVALTALLGPEAKGLSATTIVRLKQVWEQEHHDWSRRRLEDKQYVYVWADGIHFNIRLEEEPNQRQCILVLIGATPEGKKELIAIQDGYRESEQSWMELLLDVKARGLSIEPKLATGDGALGFWAALPKVFPTTRGQRCWVHKTANILDKMPKGVQGKAKEMLHQIWMAPTKIQAHQAFDHFVTTFEAKYAGAVARLVKDREALLTFYDFPAEHWVHIRTTNPIESTFATVRLRTDKTKGSGSRIACLTMVFKLAQSAQRGWRTLNGSALIPEVIAGVVFVDGEKQAAA